MRTNWIQMGEDGSYYLYPTCSPVLLALLTRQINLPLSFYIPRTYSNSDEKSGDISECNVK